MDSGRRRGASDEHTLERSVRSEQHASGQKTGRPLGLRRIWPVASLLVGYRSTAGYAPSLRLATGQIGRNERGRISERDHRSEEHTSELQSPCNLVCRLLLEKKNTKH